MKTFSATLIAVLCLNSVWADTYELIGDKESYLPGEAIKLKFKNNSSKTVELDTTWPKITDDQGQLICSNLELTVEVGPKSSYPLSNSWWEWNQKDLNGKAVPSGKYWATVDVYPDGAGSSFMVSKSFTIAAPQGPGGLSLTTQKPVYQAWALGEVVITLTNNSATPVTFAKPAPWAVVQGETLVYQATITDPLIILEPGQSIAYAWNKTKQNPVTLEGYLAPPGSYTIKFGPVQFGSQSAYLSRTIALTPTGRIAGSSMFPLEKGNTWVYELQGDPIDTTVFKQKETMTVLFKNSSGWSRVANFAGDATWMRMVGSTYPKAQIKAEGQALDFFRFNRKKGTTFSYGIGVGDVLEGKYKVASVNEKVITPAGTFTGCYRIDFIESDFMDADTTYDTFWFVPGVGMVQYAMSTTYADVPANLTYSLHHATMKGTDGKTYTIGLK